MNNRNYIAPTFLLALSLLSCIINAQVSRIDSLETYLESQDISDTSRVNAFNDLGRSYLQKSFEKGMEYSEKAKTLSEKTGYHKGLANAYNNIGVLQWQHAEYSAALLSLENALKIFSSMNDKTGMAKCYGNIGLVHRARGNLSLALEFQFRSLKLKEELKDEEGIAKSYSAIGNIYDSQQNYPLSIEYHTKASDLWTSLGNKRGVATSLVNIGNIYWEQKNEKSALEYYLESLSIFLLMEDDNGISTNYMNISMIYDKQKQYQLAYEYSMKAIAIKEKLKDESGIATCYNNLGSTLMHMNRHEEAISYLRKAIALSEKSNRKEGLKASYGTLAAVYAGMNKYKEAYHYKELYSNIKDSLFNDNSTKQIAEMQSRYESEKKQSEIELLTKDSEIQALELNRNKLWMIMLCVAAMFILALAALFYVRWQMKQKSHRILEHRNTEITLQKKEITDSINYAKRIQESILPPAEAWQKMLPDSFIFYRPKDIVSGDFYWIEQKNDIVCFAAVDCTGHGVPGALMSVVGFNLLTQAVNEVNLVKPAEILKHLDAGVTKTLRQSEEGKGVKDGMDLSLCTLNRNTLELQYAGAFNSLYYVSNGILAEIKADKYPIGVNTDGKVDNYTNHIIRLQKGDCVYLYSDGYADQFGGPKGKKFKYNQLKEMLASIAALPIEEQEKELAARFDSWKGDLEQVDDVLIIGVRV
ncbi:MAG TPA: tetratricopeptide repeat protein [Bacteroidia bacterium]|jgi:serine phosphatase RsbU (regulator of sigma subunit)/pterin-4a-carbinolamine dehydratase